LALAVARLHGAASLPAELNCCFRFAHEKQLTKRSGAHWQHWHGSSVCVGKPSRWVNPTS
jgi:hypothetical protein